MALKWQEVLRGLPEPLLIQFNKMNQTAKQYTVNRILGFSKVDSLRNAGSNAKDGKSLSSTAQTLEDRNPQIEEIVAYAQEHNLESQLMNDKSAFAKSLEQKKAEAEIQQLNHATDMMTPNMAESINFYRRVVNGSIKSYKITEKYGPDGKTLIERKREIIDDVESKMRAREKLDRMLGLNAIQNCGTVQIGGINIRIVDASKKDEQPEPDIQEDAIVTDVIDGEEAIVEPTIIENEPEVVVEKPQRLSRKEEKAQFDKGFDAAYEKILEKRAKKKGKS